MKTQYLAVETLYHLTKPRDYAQMVLTRIKQNQYEVSVRYSCALHFEHSETREAFFLFDLHEAMNVFRDCYVSLLQDGYCYWGLIPADKHERERTLEKDRLLQLTEAYVHRQALAALKAWRDRQAKSEKVRPSAVLSDRSLRSLATFLPQNEEELTNCPGIGKVKQTHYGAAILGICGKYERQFHTPLSGILPKYKQRKDDEEERFLPYRGQRIPARNPDRLRKKAFQIGETGVNVSELALLSKIDDRETRKRAASAANKLKDPRVTRSMSHLLFDEGPQVRQYMLRAVISSRLNDEMKEEVRRLLAIEPKPYNRRLCHQILNDSSESR